MFARALASSSRLARTYTTAATRPYFVERTTNGMLPVYSDIRNGGTQVLTLVRKIQGDAEALRADLAQYLADGHIDPLKAPPTVTVRPTTKQIVIKGRAVEEVKAWLEMRGF